MVLILLVSALRIFLLLLLICTQRRRGRRDQQKGMRTRRRSPRRTRRVRRTRKTRSLVYSLTPNLLAEAILNNLLLVFLFPLILIQSPFLLTKPHNKHNHLLLTLPHRFQLPFLLHPYKQKQSQSSQPLLNRYQQSILTFLIQKPPNPFLLTTHFHRSLSRVILM